MFPVYQQSATNAMGGMGFVFAGQRTLSLILCQHQQQTHLELALRRDAVQTVLVKAETLAGVQLVVPALVADDGLAFQRLSLIHI